VESVHGLQGKRSVSQPDDFEMCLGVQKHGRYAPTTGPQTHAFSNQDRVLSVRRRRVKTGNR
jgi:hypothetical protein